MSVSHRFRVWFADHTSRDVYATSEERAKVTGERAQRIVGFKKLATKAVRAEDLGHAGTGQEYCPRCRQPSLFPAVQGAAC